VQGRRGTVHAMNRGHEGKCIFSKDREKEFFLKLLVETSKIIKIRIKEKAGLQYDEIIKFAIFSDIKRHSLGRMYRDTKKRMLKKKE
jgi:hypothetical protein